MTGIGLFYLQLLAAFIYFVMSVLHSRQGRLNSKAIALGCCAMAFFLSFVVSQNINHLMVVVFESALALVITTGAIELARLAHTIYKNYRRLGHLLERGIYMQLAIGYLYMQAYVWTPSTNEAMSSIAGTAGTWLQWLMALWPVFVVLHVAVFLVRQRIVEANSRRMARIIRERQLNGGAG